MELAIPLLAAGGLYMVANQSKNKKNKAANSSETFQNNTRLPNVDVPDINYPSNGATEDATSLLSTVNKYDGRTVYTDKYFNPELNQKVVESYSPLNDESASSFSSSFTSLTGEKVTRDYFRHNNMVPFFGGNIRSRNVDANANESILDNYSGTGSQIIIKKEQAPMFAPGENYQWAHGAPNTTDFMRSRINPSMYMSNVKPFEEERVGPGLGLGYSNQGAGGFNSGMMSRDSWMEKNVDQLRAVNNPKPGGNMLLGYEGPAIHAVTTRGELGTQEKHGPDTAFEMGPERYLTTTGNKKGNTVRSEPIDRATARQTSSISYAGVAASQYGNSGRKYVNGMENFVDGEYEPSHRVQLGTAPIGVAGASGKGGVSNYDYGIKSQYAYPNNRATVRQDGYFGAIGGAFGAAVAPLLDVLRPSRKENTIGTLRPYQNPASRVTASYMFDPNDRPAPTIRDTTHRDGIYTNVNANQRGGAYEITGNQPIQNARDTTNVSYTGVAGGNERYRTYRSQDAEYNQRNNDIKSSTIDGRMVQGNLAIFSGDVTMSSKAKDSYLKNDRPLGPNGPKSSASLYNFGQTPKTPMEYNSGIQLDRNTGDVLTALQGNPYAIPYRAK